MEGKEKYIVLSSGKDPRSNDTWLKRVVLLLIFSIFAYVAIVLYYTWNGVYVPDSLTYTFVPGIIGELGITGMITRKKKDVEQAYFLNDQQNTSENIL